MRAARRAAGPRPSPPRRSGGPGWRGTTPSAAGVWISIAKKGTGIESVRYPEVLEHAICFGWIDGRRERLDEARFLQRFTPRRVAQPVVEDQPREGRAAVAGGADGARGARGGAPRQGGRPLGAGLRLAAHGRGARGSAARARRAPRGRGGVLRAELAEPLRDPLPARPGAAPRDAGEAARRVPARCSRRARRCTRSSGSGGRARWRGAARRARRRAAARENRTPASSIGPWRSSRTSRG